ncbi:hypothetical protein Pfo_011522 [Paulownia fortunei]|nr:hypothetical protein Pfo_011522 [Paulownia fortunei]
MFAAEVFSDTQPLIQSVQDRYNTRPDRATEEEWGVNYRALNDLFRISQSMESSFLHQYFIEYLFFLDFNTLGISSTIKPNGLAIPDANICSVNSTLDILELIDIRLKNRAKSSTALNEKNVVSIHARGKDLKSGSSLRGSLHLINLVGSESRPYEAKTLIFVQLNPDSSSYGCTQGYHHTLSPKTSRILSQHRNSYFDRQSLQLRNFCKSCSMYLLPNKHLHTCTCVSTLMSMECNILSKEVDRGTTQSQLQKKNKFPSIKIRFSSVTVAHRYNNTKASMPHCFKSFPLQKSLH